MIVRNVGSTTWTTRENHVVPVLSQYAGESLGMTSKLLKVVQMNQLDATMIY